ncbi:hypothetical protein TrST_g10473 [Triparma strigata]|uniref:Uncharacterized protein n=1 Tax=Triparma strigata TaxID=1606541 RepID=A0A9W7AL95_9STRA|nr:hypothetical protein TrST_g10473 [Triparma strigata]
MRRPVQPPTAEQKRHDLVGAAKPLSRPSSQSSFGVVTNATSSLLKSLGVGGPAPPSVKASSGIQALLDGGGSGPTVVSYDDDGSPPKVSKPSMKKNKSKGPARPNFSTSKHPVKPKQPNTKSSPARRWKPKRDPSNPYDDELGGKGEQKSPRSNGIPGLGGNQQEEQQEVYFDARNVQRQQQPPLSSANDDPKDDPDYQSYKLFKEQTLRKNEQEDREMEMLLELQRKAEEIERRAQMSREQQQQQQQMQMQMSNQQQPPPMSIPGLGPPQGNPFQSQPLQPQTIPGLGAPPPMQMPMQQMQIPGLQSAQQQQLPPADDLDFQEFKLFKQQEALKKQREERERMQRQLDQQSLQMSQMNMNTNMNTNMDMNNPYANPNPPQLQLQLQLQPQQPQGNANPYNYESENNTLGHSQSFGNGFQQNNFSDPTQGHRSHYDHNHNVESNPNVGGYNQQNNFSDPSQGHRSHYNRNHNAESSSGNNFSSQPGHAPSPERKTFGIKSFFTNPKTEDGQEGQPPPMTMTSPTGNPNSSVSYHSPSPGGKTKHMQALSLMNGPSLDERNGKLQKEIEYRNLLKQQMQEVEERKAKERREKKERQERELAELMEFETHSAKKISKDKKVLANTEFGGQSVKGMLYGGDGSPKRQPRDSPHRSPNRNKRDQLDQREEPNIDVPNFASTTPNNPDIRLPPDLSSSVRSDGDGGMGGFAALLSKTGGGGEGGGGIPGLDGGGGHDNPYLDDDVDNDGGQSQMQMQMQMQMPMDPRMAQKEQQIDQLSTMYADLMEEQKAMREALAAQQEEVKKVREREKTLRAGQRGGARRQNKATKGATRDAGGRLIKENGNKSGLLRTQSARRRGDAGPADPYERGNEHYLSPGRRGKKGLGKPKGKGTSSFAGPSEKKYPRGVNRFGFKDGTTTKMAGGGGGGSGPPRDAGGRLIRKKVVETQSRRNPYDDDGDDDYGRGGGGGGIPGLGGRSPARSNNNPYSDDVGGGAGYDYEPSSAAPPDPRQYSPRLEENHHVQELGGDSDLLYNDPSLDPAHGSIISADQLDRLMLKGLRQDEW